MTGRTTDTKKAQQQLHSQWKSHHALEKMASMTSNTANLWTSDNANVVLFREYAQSAILPVMNCEASLCAMQMQNEAGRSAYAFVCSCVGKQTNNNVNVEMKTCERGGANPINILVQKQRVKEMYELVCHLDVSEPRVLVGWRHR